MLGPLYKVHLSMTKVHLTISHIVMPRVTISNIVPPAVTISHIVTPAVTLSFCVWNVMRIHVFLVKY